MTALLDAAHPTLPGDVAEISAHRRRRIRAHTDTSSLERAIASAETVSPRYRASPKSIGTLG